MRLAGIFRQGCFTQQNEELACRGHRTVRQFRQLNLTARCFRRRADHHALFRQRAGLSATGQFAAGSGAGTGFRHLRLVLHAGGRLLSRLRAVCRPFALWRHQAWAGSRHARLQLWHGQRCYFPPASVPSCCSMAHQSRLITCCSRRKGWRVRRRRRATAWC